jgi:hypothetical protein
LTDKENRDKAVMDMAERMIELLDDNSHKGGWDEFTAYGAIEGLRQEIKELETEMTKYQFAVRNSIKTHPERVEAEALDVANWLMFLLEAIKRE